MVDNFPSVGERIKSIRKQHKLTQIEFAQSLDISQGTLSEIESGKAKPSFDVLVLLSDMYLVDMNWLIINREAELRVGLKNDELFLLENYRKLEQIAKDELLDYTNLKLLRFQRKK
ncbi:helix-turn-helix domain-containing protein [Paenibacillus sp. MBLB2552]|uniref:Helix-turn-helix domain-containing protein n=1 Tax=Paenibacillus mellifer TaxID=2937794 RepID=A0A9X2BTS3_9BACL|nr:helix-turn-helix transcriptional regulator [Paenibacillus mellifer]MCK8488256.1 helix-turn-helix domain-containing protein [Paenibacillus mellifer]